MRYDELDKAIEIINNSLNSVQNEFDNYQNRCFHKRTPEFFCLELNGEAGELANIEKKRWKGKIVPDEKFEDEAADVLIALMNYCNARKVKLGAAVQSKLLKIDAKRLNLESRGEEY